MRIRTIKPEFWKSESMSSVSEFARLMAIGLLNYADDFGYFYTNPLLIRSDIFPFEARLERIGQGLQELSKIEYIKFGKTSDGRNAAKIVAFVIHQRIDRPKPSKISETFKFDDGSSIDRRIVDELSLLEGKGRERKGRERSDDASSPTADLLTALEANPAYEGIDVRHEYHRMHAWCGVNGKKPTERRFVNWLNRCEKPLPKPARRGSPNI